MTEQEAIERIQNDLKLHHDDLSGQYRKALRLAIFALEKQEQDRWIPCSERIPEGECDVLVTDKFGEVAHAVYLHWDGDWCFVSAEEYMMLEDVKAWKLVPEPYKEG